MWTMNPPVAWTYPTQTAIADQSFFPGQSLTQIDAQNQANGDITAAVNFCFIIKLGDLQISKLNENFFKLDFF